MSDVVLITGCSSGIGRYLAGLAFPGRLVMALRDFVWDAVVRSMFKSEAI